MKFKILRKNKSATVIQICLIDFKVGWTVHIFVFVCILGLYHLVVNFYFL